MLLAVVQHHGLEFLANVTDSLGISTENIERLLSSEGQERDSTNVMESRREVSDRAQMVSKVPNVPKVPMLTGRTRSERKRRENVEVDKSKFNSDEGELEKDKLVESISKLEAVQLELNDLKYSEKPSDSKTNERIASQYPTTPKKLEQISSIRQRKMCSVSEKKSRLRNSLPCENGDGYRNSQHKAVCDSNEHEIESNSVNFTAIQFDNQNKPTYLNQSSQSTDPLYQIVPDIAVHSHHQLDVTHQCPNPTSHSCSTSPPHRLLETSSKSHHIPAALDPSPRLQSTFSPLPSLVPNPSLVLSSPQNKRGSQHQPVNCMTFQYYQSSDFSHSSHMTLLSPPRNISSMSDLHPLQSDREPDERIRCRPSTCDGVPSLISPILIGNITLSSLNHNMRDTQHLLSFPTSTIIHHVHVPNLPKIQSSISRTTPLQSNHPLSPSNQSPASSNAPESRIRHVSTEQSIPQNATSSFLIPFISSTRQSLVRDSPIQIHSTKSKTHGHGTVEGSQSTARATIDIKRIDDGHCNNVSLELLAPESTSVMIRERERFGWREILKEDLDTMSISSSDVESLSDILKRVSWQTESNIRGEPTIGTVMPTTSLDMDSERHSNKIGTLSTMSLDAKERFEEGIGGDRSDYHSEYKNVMLEIKDWMKDNFSLHFPVRTKCDTEGLYALSKEKNFIDETKCNFSSTSKFNNQGDGVMSNLQSLRNSRFLEMETFQKGIPLEIMPSPELVQSVRISNSILSFCSSLNVFRLFLVHVLMEI